MAAGLAHEVKNPLGAIKGAAQLLSDPRGGTELEPSAHEFLGIILEEVDRLDRVVGSVLDYARPSKGDPGAVDVNAVAKGTLRVLASDRQGCELRTELAPDLPLVRADAEQLRQVLMNLVRNAVQAMNGSGQVAVVTRMRPSRESSWAGAPGELSNGWVEIAIIDQGPGIAPHLQKNLFIPFFTTKNKGTGLGLAISQRMVEEMGGRIEVSSQPGSGSTFTVVLPAAPADILGSRPPPAEAAREKLLSTPSPDSTPAPRPAPYGDRAGVGQSGRRPAAANETIRSADEAASPAHEAVRPGDLPVTDEPAGAKSV
jgi:signal transduction histidine kinase